MKKIEEYDFPGEIKNMSFDELDLLSYQIREFLIEKVAKTGGHLASNLGAVEITIAMHKVFDSPKDKFIFDVGHQSYIHKILTGRSKQFDTLRQFNGLSGFPKSRESLHDAYETGHSTTSLSAACGMAAARDIKGENNEIVAVIGDGSLTGGMAYEALNVIGGKKLKTIIILNDNGMSISKNVGSISKYLSQIRTSKGYLGAKNFVKKNLNTNIKEGLANAKNDLKYSLMDDSGIFFEELGITYFGPIDGHNIKDLCAAMEKAKALEEPCVIHCLTKKGKGYKNAESMPRKFHGIGPFDPETGEVLGKSKLPSFSKIMGDHLLEMAKDNKDIIAITAAMGEAVGLKEYSIEIPDRYFDVGIAEQHAVTFAAGLAKSGLKPFVCIYSSFLQRAYDQMIEDVCLQNLPVVFCIDRAGVVGADGETHHGILDLSYLRTMPNMTILVPKDGNELVQMMDYAYKLNSPVAIRYPRGTTKFDKDIKSLDVFDPSSKRIDDGVECEIWSLGNMFDLANDVRNLINKEGYECGLVDVTQVKPLDVRPYKDCKVKLIATIEDNSVVGGFGEELSRMLSSKNVKILNFGWPDKFIEHGSILELMNEYGLTKENIAEEILKKLKK